MERKGDGGPDREKGFMSYIHTHSKAQDFACLKNCNKHFAKFLGSVRVGTTRKTWSQTLVTSRAH